MCRFIDHHLIYTPAIPLASGTRLGSYEILSALGAGGMGEVYRARDTKLNRDVALKVLLPAVANDPDRLARFSREAQVLASLNHPNIAAIYGIEESNGVTALVMELVEGEDLSQRIARGPIPIDEALPIARQIADALEAAHEHGVIHRDLKPANIKVRPDGTVKVLDFGLAKAIEPAGGSSVSMMNSPTLSIHATEAGLILGTAAYMSPEQAAGKSVDKRSDLWAFGVVLMEMLTGRQTFAGESVSHVLAAVLKDQPDWAALPVATPQPIRRLLRRCLEKDRKRRLADAADARLEVDDANASSVDGMARGAGAVGSGRRLTIAWSAAVLFAVAAAALAAKTAMRPAEADAPILRSTFVLNEQLHNRPPANRFALAPNGRSLAFAGNDASGRIVLWVRSLDGTPAKPLAGTDNATAPFWSPDSRFIAFSTGGRLMKVDASGGTPVTIYDPGGRFEGRSSGSWNRDNVILFNSQPESALVRVSAVGGGAQSAVTTLDVAAGETHHGYPFFLPDQRHFLFVAFKGYLPLGLYLGSIDSMERRLLIEGASNAQYTDDALVFARGTVLMAQPFDPATATLTGEATPIGDQVQVNTAPYRAAAFTVSTSGTLVYQPGIAGGNTRMTWTDRAGRPTPVVGEMAAYRDLSMSSDGTLASVSLANDRTGASDLWILNPARGLRTRLTFDAADEYVGVWSPDDKDIVFNSSRQGHLDLYRTASGGGGHEELLFADAADKTPTSWSPDRKFILYSAFNPTSENDVWVLPLSGERKPIPFANTAFEERWGQFSPDGRWVAYTSNESGRTEVYVARFPNPGPKWQISTTGGGQPRWRRDGKELFYHSPDNKLMATPIRIAADRVDTETARPLFEMRNPGGVRSFYDTTPDGQRFLHNVEDESATTPLTMLVNWPALLKRGQ